MKKILISARHKEHIEYTFWPTLEAWYHTFWPIAELNCLPLLLPAHKFTQQQAKEYIKNCDILLLTWWYDIDPKQYGEKIMFDSVQPNTYRDDNELLLIHEAIYQQKTIIGICRWMQIINVALWWTLYQDIAQQWITNKIHDQEHTTYKELSHQVTIKQKSFLFDIYKKKELLVNSFHHQAIKTLWNDLEIIAYSTDGIIEAIQHKMLPIYAVQWHPERSYFFDRNSVQLMEYFCSR